MRVSCIRDACSSAFSLSSSDQPESPPNRSLTSSRARRKTGSCASSSRPIAHHCWPMPEQTNTGFDGVPEMRPFEAVGAAFCPEERLELLRQFRLVVRRPEPGDTHDGTASPWRKSRCRGAPRAASRARPEARRNRTAPRPIARIGCAPKAAASRRLSSASSA